jgi:Cu+-exporting ATPase
MLKDPVCGMKIDEKSTTILKSDYRNKTYYFCSRGCKKSFDDNPSKYTGESTDEEQSCCC